MSKSPAQLDAEIAEAEAEREYQAQRVARAARKAAQAKMPTGLSTYDQKIWFWNDHATRWGKPAAIAAAITASAGDALGRDFGEAMEAYFARTPRAQATRDWLRANKGT